MTLGKRRTRSISLDGRRFRWRCDFGHPTEKASAAFKEGLFTDPDRLIIRSGDGPHRLLRVCWPACEGPVVTPGIVRSCIEEALRRGWLRRHSTLEFAGSEAPLNSHVK